MNKRMIAKELVKIAKALIAIEFDTKEEYDKYMKDHPGANKSNHSVKSKKQSVDPWSKEGQIPRERNDLTGLHKDIKGSTLGIKGKINPGLRGNVTNLKGDVSNIWGDIDYGTLHDQSGDVSNLKGDISNIYGDLSGISGKLNPDIYGDATGIKMKITGYSGDLADLKNYVD